MAIESWVVNHGVRAFTTALQSSSRAASTAEGIGASHVGEAVTRFTQTAWSNAHGDASFAASYLPGTRPHEQSIYDVVARAIPGFDDPADHAAAQALRATLELGDGTVGDPAALRAAATAIRGARERLVTLLA